MRYTDTEIDLELFDFFQGLQKPSGNTELTLASSYCSYNTFQNKKTRFVFGKLSSQSQLTLRTHYSDTPNLTRQCFKLPRAAGAAYLATLPINPIYNKLYINLLSEYSLFNYEPSLKMEDQITAHNSLPMWKALQQTEKQLILSQLIKLHPNFKTNQISSIIQNVKDQMKELLQPALHEFMETKARTFK